MEQMTEQDSKQYVVFKMGKDEYGVDIQRVTTIEKMMTIARVPKTPNFIKGVINLRGEIIPIIDLRERFGLSQVEETEETRIIILKFEDISAGIIVDMVDEVVQLTQDLVVNITNFASDVYLDYIYGVGRFNDRVITLLNTEKLVKFSEG